MMFDGRSIRVDIVKHAKILNLLVSTLMIITGILLFLPIFNARSEKIVIGILYVVVGVSKLFGFFSNDMYRLAFQFDLGFGLFALILGTLMLASPEKFNATFSNSIGMYVTMESALKMQIAYDAKRFGIARWRLLGISALALCAVGILTIISFYSDELRQDVMMALALVSVGMENVWVTAYTVRIQTKKSNFSEWLEQDSFDDEL